MKTSSWEIIIAGLLFVGISIYLTAQHSEPQKPTTASVSADSVRVNWNGDRLKVIELRSLQNLKNLENLENLENLKNLQNLKNITTFLPAEIQEDFNAEIDAVIKEFDQESVRVDFNSDEGTVSINRAMSISQGEWTAVSPGIFSYVKEFNSSELEEADLNLPFGSIEIIGGDNKQGKITIRASGQVSTREELRSKIETVENISQQRASFTINPKGDSVQNSSVQLHAVLSLPSNVEVRSVTEAGHISSKNITGNQTYQTSGGHISLQNLSGDVEANTGGGHISIRDSKGVIHLNSKGGNIKSLNSEGTLVMKTSGGSLEAHDITGSVEASTTGGNIELRFLEMLENSFATTGAGTITLWFPANANAKFDFSGNTVELDPAFNFLGDKSSGTLKGSIGSGAPTITAKTNYGKINVKVLD